ncbi:MAG: sigma-70 family RNA polymerase sigma factor [Acidimicrobiales bacterium]
MDPRQPSNETGLRPLMFSIGYGMTGSVAEAEDLVQEAFFRLERARQSGMAVESPKAYLAAATTRLAIDHLRSARARRESYVGAWLTEPIVADLHDSPEQMAELSDSLSMAFLVLLESLSPVERAVFLLREVFDYPYEDIAQIVDKSEANCRQIFGRARQHIGARHARYEASREHSETFSHSRWPVEAVSATVHIRRSRMPRSGRSTRQALSLQGGGKDLSVGPVQRVQVDVFHR